MSMIDKKENENIKPDKYEDHKWKVRIGIHIHTVDPFLHQVLTFWDRPCATVCTVCTWNGRVYGMLKYEQQMLEKGICWAPRGSYAHICILPQGSHLILNFSFAGIAFGTQNYFTTFYIQQSECIIVYYCISTSVKDRNRRGKVDRKAGNGIETINWSELDETKWCKSLPPRVIIAISED